MGNLEKSKLNLIKDSGVKLTPEISIDSFTSVSTPISLSLVSDKVNIDLTEFKQDPILFIFKNISKDPNSINDSKLILSLLFYTTLSAGTSATIVLKIYKKFYYYDKKDKKTLEYHEFINQISIPINASNQSMLSVPLDNSFESLKKLKNKIPLEISDYVYQFEAFLITSDKAGVDIDTLDPDFIFNIPIRKYLLNDFLNSEYDKHDNQRDINEASFLDSLENKYFQDKINKENFNLVINYPFNLINLFNEINNFINSYDIKTINSFTDKEKDYFNTLKNNCVSALDLFSSLSSLIPKDAVFFDIYKNFKFLKDLKKLNNLDISSVAAGDPFEEKSKNFQSFLESLNQKLNEKTILSLTNYDIQSTYKVNTLNFEDMYNIEVKYYDEENSRNLAFYPSIKNDEEKIIPAFFILNHLKENILPVLDELFYNLSPVNRMIIKDEINIESDILNSFSINKYSFSIITKNIIPSINYNDTIIFNIDFYFQTINPVDLKG